MHPVDLQAPTDARAVADFTAVRPLGRSGDFVVATPPPRLADVGDILVLRVFNQDDMAEPERKWVALRGALTRIAGVRSPFLSPLVEAGRTTDLIYYATPYAPAGSLGATSAAGFNFAQVLQAVSEAARGAHELHRHGIVHGNIHPGAVLLGARSAQLTDFVGIDGESAEALTPLARRSRPAYAAQSVLGGGTPTVQTDLYSLGATLHFAASGQSLYPHLGATFIPTVADVLASPPTIAQGLPGPIEQIVRACILPTQHDLSTAAQLAERLESLWKR